MCPLPSHTLRLRSSEELRMQSNAAGRKGPR
jgi:hypothetical protein